MDGKNQTSVTEFTLLGLTDDPKLKILLFVLFFIVYVSTTVSNIGISALIVMESQLHTPMYFFLSNLSISDFCYSSVTAPKLLKDLLSEKQRISFICCTLQTFFLLMFGAFEGYTLSAMAYDRFVAICHPLLYTVIMNWSMCTVLAIVVYLSGCIVAASLTACIFHASFCGSNVIDHFSCDVPPLMELSCSDRFIREIIFVVIIIFIGLGSLLITVASYVYIISAILKIPSAAGRQKTFSICGAHLTSLSLLYVTSLVNYLRPQGSGSAAQKKIMSVCYMTLPPLLNPLIYSLRNNEVKGVMWTIIHRKCH